MLSVPVGRVCYGACANLIEQRLLANPHVLRVQVDGSHGMAHVAAPQREVVYRRLAATVRPVGSLLILGHHPSDLEATMRRPNLPDLFFTAEQVGAGLDPDDWQVVVVASPERQAIDSEGRTVSMSDAVMNAVRRSSWTQIGCSAAYRVGER